MDWMKTENPIYFRSDYENKDLMSENGAKYDTDKRRWYIPIGKNPLEFRNDSLFSVEIPTKMHQFYDFWSVLNVPYDERLKVKKKGARFDNALKKWYVPSSRATGKFIDFDDFTEYWPTDLQKFIFNDDFIARSIIAESGQSVVLGGFSLKSGEKIAIKLFRNSNTRYEKNINELQEAYNRELKHLRSTLENCDNTLSVLDFGFHKPSSCNFIVTPWIPLTLDTIMFKNLVEQAEIFARAILREDDLAGDEYDEIEIEILNGLKKEYENNSPWDLIKEDIEAIVNSLVAVYKIGIIHRDIKPDNIFIDIDQETKDITWLLGDFGSSKMIESIASRHNITTVDIRTEPWGPARSPEEKRHQETWDAFSCAAIVVAGVTRQYPYTDEDLRELLEGKCKQLLDKDIYKVIHSALDEEPSKRPKNIIEFKKLLKI